MSWYQENPTKEEFLNKQKETYNRRIMRFFLKAGDTKKVIFMDDEPFAITEHNPTINGEFWHYFTCRKGVDAKDPVCPLCMIGDKAQRMYTAFLTVLDASGWKNKDGDVVKYSRMLFPMTMKSFEKFNFYKNKYKDKGMVGACFELGRTGKSDPKLGDNWDYEGHVDPYKDEKYWYESKMGKGGKKAPEPFNYMDLLKPVSKAEMKMLVAQIGQKGLNLGDDGGEGGDFQSDEDALY